MTVQHPLKLQEAAFLDESKVCLMRADSQETDLHEHEFLELTYVTRGSAQHQLGAAVMELHAGDYFLVDLGSLHSYRNGQGLEVINCLFSPAYVDRALVHCPSLATLLSTDMRQFGAPVVSPADRVFHDSNGDILRLMEAMEREYAQRAVGYLEMIRCHLIQVLVRTIRSAAVGGLAAGGIRPLRLRWMRCGPPMRSPSPWPASASSWAIRPSTSAACSIRKWAKA